MFSRYRQGGDVHGDAAIHVESPDQEETATTNYSSAEKHKFTSIKRKNIMFFYLPLCCWFGQLYLHCFHLYPI